LSAHFWKISVGFLTVLALGGSAAAQDFSAGKTAAQLFASDCSACHKSPAGLAKGQSVGSLTSFLREHYTTKPESASALAAYVAGAGPGNARLNPQAPIGGTGPKANEEKPKPRTATTALEPVRPQESETSPPTPREAAKPSTDPVVTKLNSYAAARGEAKDTARLAVPGNKLESYANSGAAAAEATAPDDQPNDKRKPADKKDKKNTTASTGEAAAPHGPQRPRRAQAPTARPAPDRQ
jgi:hypothetical protein